MAANLRERFRDLPRDQQRDLLLHRWHEIAGPEMIPILQDLIEAQPAGALLGDVDADDFRVILRVETNSLLFEPASKIVVVGNVSVVYNCEIGNRMRPEWL